MSERRQAALDARALRSALGRFVTGVTVVTTCADDGSPVGLTVNSFNSVSLDPPLVLWSLSRASSALQAFERAPYFAVHVLGAHQVDISRRFATRGPEKFAGVEYRMDPVPLLAACVARFVCRNVQQYPGGDHAIFVGEVLSFDTSSEPPLVFHEGWYADLRHRVPASAR